MPSLCVPSSCKCGLCSLIIIFATYFLLVASIAAFSQHHKVYIVWPNEKTTPILVLSTVVFLCYKSIISLLYFSAVLREVCTSTVMHSQPQDGSLGKTVFYWQYSVCILHQIFLQNGFCVIIKYGQ